MKKIPLRELEAFINLFINELLEHVNEGDSHD